MDPHISAIKLPRRRALIQAARLSSLLLASGLVPAAALENRDAAFAAPSRDQALQALGLSSLSASDQVQLVAPEIAEDGASVRISLACTAPGVRRLLLLIDGNPAPLSALYEVSEALEPAFAMNAKLAQTSEVYAVALLDDGRALYASRLVKVTLGGCGG